MIRQRYVRSPIRWLLGGLLAVIVGGATLRADERMRQVQEELRKRHLYFGDVDGRYTPELAGALKNYQGRKGFAATGEADETTLRSLTLLPPSAAHLPGPPLPDITVLRSDEGRAPAERTQTITPAPLTTAPTPSPPTSTPAPAASPPPSPPPMPVSSPPPASPDMKAIRAFIASYLRAGQSNDPDAEMKFYADRVDYFDDGVVDRGFIEQDVRRYERRWPDRQFSLSGPFEAAVVSERGPATLQVHCRYRFLVKGNHYSGAGQVDSEYLLSGERPEELRIVSMKEQRVRP